jgi:hypothetical protein
MLLLLFLLPLLLLLLFLLLLLLSHFRHSGSVIPLYQADLSDSSRDVSYIPKISTLWQPTKR